MAMEINRRLCGVVLLLVFVMFTSKGEAQLTLGYYTATCPDVESIVKEAITKKFNETFTTAPAVLRLFFHDCFVEGCDASVLIASPDGDAEKDAEDNVSLAGDGFDAVIRAKTAVEEKCPGVVSCADILTIATRDVVVLTGGPSYEVELGRRDGLVSKASRVKGNLPQPEFDLEKLNKMFSKHDLNQIDVIALSGAHTIGFSHCDRFSDRLYSFNESYPVDPSLDPEYAKQLKLACPKDADPSIAINMDPVTPNKFDNVYYKNLVHGKGLFTSDQVLFTDTDSRSTVRAFASSPSVFKGAFVVAITKLGRVDVKTGDDGEIRNDCSAFNS